ncbi:sulfur carrier protein ThiS adenylyltransferase ThiF [bacterium]|nr:sulfur carrier protein ThiS adenylyltransferase ThiF [bacterium]
MIFDRNIPGTSEILQKKCVAVAGCGGLGSNIAIALVRSGVGNLIIADFDKVETSNLNRQQYLFEDIGKLKASTLATHLKKINPEVSVKVVEKKLEPSDIKDQFSQADIMIEAFDAASSKLWLIESWTEAFPERPIVVGSGMSGLGKFEDIHVRKAGNLYICGDEQSEMTQGLMAPRVAIVANLQAMTAIEILLRKNNL